MKHTVVDTIVTGTFVCDTISITKICNKDGFTLYFPCYPYDEEKLKAVQTS